VSFRSALLATDLLKSALQENGIIPEDKPAVPEELLKYAGVYGENGKFVTVEIKDGAFELPELISLIPAQQYRYAGDGLFKSADGKVVLRFEERGGLTFLQGDITLTFPDIGEVKWKSFLYQKLEKNPLDEKVAAAWEKRKDKKYWTVDEKYTSPGYITASPFSVMEITLDKEMGYAHGGCKIIDENRADNVLWFRDVCDLKFFTEDGAEYLSTKGSLFIGEDYIPVFNPAEKTVTLNERGHTKYFKIDEKSAGTVTVQLPPSSAFAAYNSKGEYKSLSTINGANTATLESGDMIAFIGGAGAVFKL
jgi:hypothetical protein